MESRYGARNDVEDEVKATTLPGDATGASKGYQRPDIHVISSTRDTGHSHNVYRASIKATIGAFNENSKRKGMVGLVSE